MRHLSIPLRAALIAFTAAHFARAEPAKSAATAGPSGSTIAVVPASSTVRAAAGTRGYMYQFTDDPLAAGGFDAHDARIVVQGHGIRATLIRPRTAFVVEMLKSVENL